MTSTDAADQTDNAFKTRDGVLAFFGVEDLDADVPVVIFRDCYWIVAGDLVLYGDKPGDVKIKLRELEDPSHVKLPRRSPFVHATRLTKRRVLREGFTLVVGENQETIFKQSRIVAVFNNAKEITW